MEYHVPVGEDWDGGYAQFREEKTYGQFPDEKEHFDYFIKPGSGRSHETLAQRPYWGNTVLPKLAEQSENCIQQLLRAYDYALGTDFLLEKHSGNMKYRDYRFIQYEPLRDDAQGKHCGPHTDYGSLTLLMQDDVGGLEIWNIEKKRWEQATPIEGTVVINIANALQRWSNDRYMSSMHRVMHYGTSEGEEKKARHSIGYFIGPNWDVVLDASDFGIP
eukprot:TRINITY_DN3141_c0_g1_i2.p1 TRINITY_DN3141_c0_g1~~TRINITY_DN3141_c0_g1_i2.p1  ORF type:complete len:218 (+),score=46.42 TRINITY_DN3141_c0_g1_i2:192-845(+)